MEAISGMPMLGQVLFSAFPAQHFLREYLAALEEKLSQRKMQS
jgi:hypothetical protein